MAKVAVLVSILFPVAFASLPEQQMHGLQCMELTVAEQGLKATQITLWHEQRQINWKLWKLRIENNLPQSCLFSPLMTG